MPPTFVILPRMILRAAAQPYTWGQQITVEKLLGDRLFLAAIYIASPALHRQIIQQKEKKQSLSPKLKLTLLKYANRFAHRATPFGAFASFGLIHPDEESFRATIVDNYRLHLQTDFKDVLDLYEECWNKEAHRQLRSNPTIYRTGPDIRYIFAKFNISYKNEYSLRKVDFSKWIWQLIQFCSSVKSEREIILFLKNKISVPTDEASELLTQLHSIQILIPSLSPNLTGEDAVTRLSHLAGSEKNEKMIIGKNELFDLPLQQPGRHFYANLQRGSVGGLPGFVQDSLQEGIIALSKLSNSSVQDGLTDFKKAFRKKFGEHLIPLLIAVDPQSGINYDNLAGSADDELLPDGFNSSKAVGNFQQITWGPVSQLLMRKWPGENGRSLLIDENDLKTLPPSEWQFPPSISVLFQLYYNQIYFEQAGGNSAISLNGRFTPFDQAIENHCLDIAKRESAINPDIIFAELVFSSDGHVDNINRRKHIRSHEICISNFSTLPAERQIQLSDLYLAVNGDELLLWSKRLKKRIIPRMSSAFNFMRCDLMVARLLGDLQYQGLHHTLQLDLTIIFPGLSYYPRVTYKNCVLATATWIIQSSEDFKMISQFREFARLKALPRYFLLVTFDQTLAIDLNNDDSLELFFKEAQNLKKIVIKEHLKEADLYGSVVNEQSQTLAHQYVAAVCNKDNVYPQTAMPNLKKKTTVKQYFAGSEWLYYKVYCFPFNSNKLLIQIGTYLRRMQKRGVISHWFFVRYLDPEPHLRIRINAPQSQLNIVITQLEKFWIKMLHRQSILDVQINIYEQETERYTPQLIHLVEMLFSASSAVVMSFVSDTRATHHTDLTYLFACQTAYDMICQFLPEPEYRLQYLKVVKSNLFHEFGNSHKLKISLDDQKRKLVKDVSNFVSRPYHFQDTLTEAINAIKKESKSFSNQLIADLVHMHINRIFPADMRERELIVYTLILQYEITYQKTNMI